MSRRRQRFAFNHRNTVGAEFSELPLSECYITAYYFYKFLALSCDVDLEDCFNFFMKLAKHLKKTEAIYAFAEKAVDEYVEKGLLTVAAEEHTTALHQVRMNEKMRQQKWARSFAEDISLLRDFSNRNITKENINIIRCISLEDEKFFARLVYNFLLLNNPTENLNTSQPLDESIYNAIDDLSDMQFLYDEIALSDLELRFLQMQFRIGSNYELSHLVDTSDIRLKFYYEEVLEVSGKKLDQILRSDGKLRCYGFVDSDGIIDNDIAECIKHRDLELFFYDLLKKADVSDSYAAESFNVPEKSTTIIKQLLKGKNPVSILLYGKPGSGKTQYAKMIAKETNLQAFIFKNEAELQDSFEENIIGKLNCLLSLNRENSLLIIDEADTLLKTKDMFTFFGTVPSRLKASMNKMLEESKNKIIWIVNSTAQMDTSTRRRFNFSLKFEAMTTEQLRKIAASKISEVNITDTIKNQILDLLEKYDVTGASIDNVVTVLKNFEGMNEETLVDFAQTVLKENSLLIAGKTKMRQTVKASYDVAVLNTSVAPDTVVEMIQNAKRFSEKHKGSENGIRLLFYGLSGTGKTEFVRYIATQTGKKILLKRASDILSPYVGVAEQNIAAAFEEADRKDMILLLDEADSFFQDRSTAKNSWEVTQVNELLTQMEEFSGIFICTTNLKKIMDSAMNRRFHVLVEFKPLEEDGIQMLLTKYFTDWHFTKTQVKELARFETVTPGDFGTLASRIRFTDSEKIDAAYILHELKKIQHDKKNGGDESIAKIGF